MILEGERPLTDVDHHKRKLKVGVPLLEVLC